MTPRRVSGFVLVAALWFAVGPAAAAFVVVEARGHGVQDVFAPGDRLDRPVTLEKGQALVVDDAGRLRRLEGPGVFAPLAGEARDEGVIVRLLKGLFAAPDETTERLGATRGGDAEVAEDPRLLNVTANGPVCVADLSRITLWRGADAPAVRAAITDEGTRRRRFFTWPAGTAAVAWPDRIEPRFDSTYEIDLGGGKRRQITLTSVAPIAGDRATLAALLSAGCALQARALVGTLFESPRPRTD